MSNLQENKAFIRRFYAELDSAHEADIGSVLSRYTSDDYFWRGMHPFYEQRGSEAVTEVFWLPFRHAVKPIQRREDIFMAGINDIPGFGTDWVCSMGHLMGLFDHDWLGIPANGKLVFLRYAEFNCIENGKIRETAMFCDIIGVMQQVGLHPLPPQTGAFFLTPGPRTHDGLLFEAQDPSESAKTLELIKRMGRDLGGDGMSSPQEKLARTWHDDMLWFGPAGIGGTFTIERYHQQHQGPFRRHLDDIQFQSHISRFAEGNYGAWFGWPNLTMRPSGGFLGLPASDRTVEMRVVDIYRRQGDKLAENWIFIDLLYFLMQQGLDVLERMRHFPRT